MAELIKICLRCELSSPLSGFYAREKYYSSYCKECDKVLATDRANKNRRRVNILQRRRREGSSYAKDYMKKWWEAHPEKRVEYDRARGKKDHKKILCRNVVRRMFYENKLKKRNICETCCGGPTECHHEDYDKPLEYIELCNKCHNLLHRRYKNE